jgi:hypothetical protein
MSLRKHALSVVALIALTGTAFALEVDAMVDTDGDGLYSFPELQLAFEEMNEDLFIAIDVNADGAVDLEEFAAAQEAALLPMSEG